MTITVNTPEQLIQAVREAETKPITVIKIDTDTGIMDLAAPVVIPKKLKALSKQLEIHLQGHTLRATTAMEYVIGRPTPVDQNESLNVMQSHGFHIHSGMIDGRSQSTNGIRMESTYHDLIEKMTVISCGSGIIEKFGMNARVSQCEVRNCEGYGIGLLRGTNPGAGHNNAGSNRSEVIQSRVFPTNNQFACFGMTSSGSVVFDGAIVDASTGNTPDRGYLVDVFSSTTSKVAEFKHWWGESPTNVAMFDLNLNGGHVHIHGGFPQYGGTMVRAAGTNYPEIYFDLTGFIPGGTKFQVVQGSQNAVVWAFRGNNTSFNFRDPANWVGGLVPGKLMVEGFGSTKGWEFHQSGPIKMNGSNIINQTELARQLALYVKK